MNPLYDMDEKISNADQGCTQRRMDGIIPNRCNPGATESGARQAARKRKDLQKLAKSQQSNG